MIDNFIKGKANFYLFDISHVSKPTGVWGDSVNIGSALFIDLNWQSSILISHNFIDNMMKSLT